VARFLYSQNLLDARNESNQSFVVPAGFVCVVRDVDTYNGTELTIETLTFQLQTLTTGATIWLWTDTLPISPQSRQWTGREVLIAGDGLVFSAYDQSSSPVGVDCRINGYMLTAP
jgi:hypothetical protein